MRGGAGLEARGIATRVNEQSEGRGERDYGARVKLL